MHAVVLFEYITLKYELGIVNTLPVKETKKNYKISIVIQLLFYPDDFVVNLHLW